MDVHRVVRAVGWDGALALCEGTWAGWQAEFLGAALGVLADLDRDRESLEQARMLFGARRG